MNRRTVAIWAALLFVGVGPVIVATMSPLLEWRSWVYILAGFSGVVSLSLLMAQPVLAAGMVPDLSRVSGRYLHRWTGGALLVCVLVHVAGLWITSPPDVIDALLFVSATPFSIWGVIALWSIVITALLAVLRHKLPLHQSQWRNTHRALAVVTASGSVVHAMMIEGTMGTVSKTLLCVIIVIATAVAVFPRGARVIRKLVVNSS